MTCTCLAGNLGLAAAQHQRADPATQLGKPVLVMLALDRMSVVLGEPIEPRKETGCRDRTKRPEFGQVVLHGRTGDGNFEECRKTASFLVRLGLRILDELRFVEDQAGPVQRRVVVVLQAEQRIGGDHDIGLSDRLGQTGSAPGRGLVDRSDVEIRGEAEGLGRPVVYDACRRDDQKTAVFAGVAKQRERLQRLTESHVVGEDAAESVVVERGQPTEAFLLVGA